MARARNAQGQFAKSISRRVPANDSPTGTSSRASYSFGVRKDTADGTFEGQPLMDFGVSGLKQTGGFLREEFHPRLRGRLSDKVYEEMELNNPLIGGALWAMESLIRQVPWEIKPKEEFSDDLEAQNLATWYEGAREDMESRWDEIISEIMSMITYGWVVLEELYKVRRGPEEEEPRLHSKFDDGLWGWRDFAIRAQDSRWRWVFNEETGKVIAMEQLVATSGVMRTLPMVKSLHFKLRSRKNNPEGRSLLRPIYRPYYFYRRQEEIESIGFERNVAGLPVFEVPWNILHPDASDAEKALKNVAKDVVQKVRMDMAMGLVIPGPKDNTGQETGMKFSLLTASGKNLAEGEQMMQRKRSDIMVGLLTQFLLLGSQSTGSHSLASEMTTLLSMSLGALLKVVTGVINECAIPRIGRLNRFPMRKLPELTHGDLEEADFLKFAQAISLLSTSGIIPPDDGLEAHARERGTLPVKDQPQRGRLMDPQAPAQSMDSLQLQLGL